MALIAIASLFALLTATVAAAAPLPTRPTPGSLKGGAPPPSSGEQTGTAPLRSLSVGASGSQVMALQRQLKRRGYRVSVDGDFGAGTKAAVRKLQRRMKMRVTGVATTSLMRRLGIRSAPATTSPAPERHRQRPIPEGVPHGRDQLQLLERLRRGAGPGRSPGQRHHRAARRTDPLGHPRADPAPDPGRDRARRTLDLDRRSAGQRVLLRPPGHDRRGPAGGHRGVAGPGDRHQRQHGRRPLRRDLICTSRSAFAGERSSTPTRTCSASIRSGTRRRTCEGAEPSGVPAGRRAFRAAPAASAADGGQRLSL